MNNLITYVEETMDTFDNRPFSPVDSLVLSQLAYINFPKYTPTLGSSDNSITISDLYKSEFFDEMFKDVRARNDNISLLQALAASPRFRDIGINYYTVQNDTAEEKQFAAITYLLDENNVYIAFRGTDGTLVGWKEDFNMAFKSPVPSQAEALKYLETISILWPGTLMIGGHSKGGNLAVYSAMMASPEIQNRISQVYSHDGPGFKAEILDSINFSNIKDKVNKTLPESSIIGMLLEQQEDYAVVKSSNVGIMQHDPFSWIVADYQFKYLDDISSNAMYVDKTLSEWVESLTDTEREELIDTLYDVLNAGEYKTLAEFNDDWKNNLPYMISKVKTLEPSKRIFIYSTLLALVSLGIKNLTNKDPYSKDNKIKAED